jgi:hypothetical protein
MKAILVLLVGALTACQPWQPHSPDQQPPPPHRGAGTGAGSSGAAGSGTASGSGDEAGMHSRHDMCALNQRIMGARNPEERQAIVEQVMPNMSQEARERHLDMMQQRCQ